MVDRPATSSSASASSSRVGAGGGNEASACGDGSRDFNQTGPHPVGPAGLDLLNGLLGLKGGQQTGHRALGQVHPVGQLGHPQRPLSQRPQQPERPLNRLHRHPGRIPGIQNCSAMRNKKCQLIG